MQAIIAIRETAFVTSPFPVILSIENHCSAEQMVRMGTTLRSVLGENLLMYVRDDSHVAPL
jgi:hypothetical protein